MLNVTQLLMTCARGQRTSATPPLHFGLALKSIRANAHYGQLSEALFSVMNEPFEEGEKRRRLDNKGQHLFPGKL